MIDTIKFKINVSERLWLKTIEKATTLTQKKRDDGSEALMFWQFPVQLPSFDRNINVFGSGHSKNTIFVEFNVPKQIFHTNVAVPTWDQLRSTVEDVVTHLRSVLDASDVMFTNQLPPLSDWIVQKIDIGMMWDYKEESEAQKVLDVYKNYSTSVYQTSCYKGRICKFYLKNPEYLIHDYKSFLDKGDWFHAQYYDLLSKGYLRFEVSLIAKEVVKHLGDNTWDSIIKTPESKYKAILTHYLKYFINDLENTLMSENEARSILMDKYGFSEGLKLAGYLHFRDNKNISKRSWIKDIPRQQRYRWNKKIKEAGVGIDAKTKVNIPNVESWYVVLPARPM